MMQILDADKVNTDFLKHYESFSVTEFSTYLLYHLLLDGYGSAAERTSGIETRVCY